MTFVGHLEELRKRIIISLIALAIASAAAFPLSAKILKILKLPAAGLIQKLAFFGPTEAFAAYLKIAIVSGFIISMPVLLYQTWKFVSPALDEGVRRHALTFIVFSFASFISGCLFSYFLLLPAALKFLLSFGGAELEPVISIGKYCSFAVAIILCTGLVFEMPVLSFILTKAGLITPRFLRRRFKYAILVIFIAAAVITPTPDVFNMILLAIPMIFLYEVSVWVSYLASNFFLAPK